jgi:hypothetical protein
MEGNNTEIDYPKLLEDVLYKLKQPFLNKTDELPTQDVGEVKSMVDERIGEIYRATTNILKAIKNIDDSSLTENSVCNIVGEKERAQCLFMQESGIPFALYQNKGLYDTLDAAAKRVLYEYPYVAGKPHANTLKRVNPPNNPGGTPIIVGNTEENIS